MSNFGFFSEEDEILFGTPEIKDKMVNSLPDSVAIMFGLSIVGSAGNHRIIKTPTGFIIRSGDETIYLENDETKNLVTCGEMPKDSSDVKWSVKS